MPINQAYKLTEEVDKEFDEEFLIVKEDFIGKGICVNGACRGVKVPKQISPTSQDKIKQFIHAIRQADREAIVREVEGMKGKYKDSGEWLGYEHVIDYLKSLNQ